jgi:hypothetical protein
MPVASDFKIEVQVDHVHQAPFKISHHAQSDPFPGGHSYELVCRGYAVIDSCERLRLPLQAKSRLDASITNNYFNLIQLMISRPAGALPDFMLNTIDTVETVDGGIRITGECSPFVGRKI